MYAAAQIAKGVAGAALTGGVEELNEMVYSVLASIGALAHRTSATDECARPFDRRRNGVVVGEGAAILVAEARPSKEPYGWLAGFGIARDTTATISDWGGDAGAVVAAMRAALDDAGIAPRDVDAVYASANSSIRADRVEARAIRALFGEVPVVATKGIFGEYAGAGSLQLAAALLAVRDSILHKSVGYEEPDPDLGLAANGQRRTANLNYVLVNSISAGGGIISAVVSKEPA
jgi:3-oxoacyl-[acyl-carrier-protein] synthase II